MVSNWPRHTRLERVMHFDAEPALVVEQLAQRPGEAQQVRDVCVDVIGDDEIGGAVLGPHGAATALIEEISLGGHPRSAGGFADINDGSMPRHGIPAARHAEAGNRRCSPPRRRESRCRDRAVWAMLRRTSWRVRPNYRRTMSSRRIGERVLRGDQCRDLQQQAVLAQPEVKRKCGSGSSSWSG